MLAAAGRLGPLKIDAPYFTISLPDDWAGNYTFKYVEPRLIMNNDGTGFGSEIAVLRAGDVSVEGSPMHFSNEYFHVAVVSNGSMPAGDNLAVDLGTPSNLPGWHVVAFSPRSNARAGEIARFGSFVQVK